MDEEKKNCPHIFAELQTKHDFCSHQIVCAISIRNLFLTAQLKEQLNFFLHVYVMNVVFISHFVTVQKNNSKTYSFIV